MPAPSPPTPLPQVGEGRKRRRKGNVHRAPYRARLEALLREGVYTFDEMVAIIRAEFPGETVSRSGIHRYDQSIRAFTEKMHELDANARAMAERFGRHAGDDTTTMLSNAIVTLVTDTAVKLTASEDVELDDVRKLAQTARTAVQVKQVSLNVRKQIEAETREKVLAEQKVKLEALGKTGAIDAAGLKTVMQAAFGL